MDNNGNNSQKMPVKRKLNLLENNGNNRRRMSLRKYIIPPVKENDTAMMSRLDINQVTKCVFLASLRLKPVPHIFQTPFQVQDAHEEIHIKKESQTESPETHSKPNSTKKKVQRVTKSKNKKREKHEKLKKNSQIVENKKNTLENNPNIKSECENELIPNLDADIETGRNSPTISVDKTSQEQQIISENEKFIVELLETVVNIPIIESQENLGGESSEVNSKLNSSVCESNSQLINDELPSGTYHNNALPPLTSPDNERNIFKEEQSTPENLLPDNLSETHSNPIPLFNLNEIKIEKNIFNHEMYILSDRNENVSNYAQVEMLEDEEGENGSESILVHYGNQEKKYRKRSPQCKICSQIFPNYLRLKKHKLEHDGDKPYLCLKCGMNHSTLEQLRAHLRIHQGKHPYECKKCGKGFKTSKSLEKHEPVHVLKKIIYPKKMFKCETCLKEFRKVCDLERHTRVHTGEKPSICNICNRGFQQAHNLNKHLLIHTKEKPFVCEICNKKFGRNDVLNRHLLTHSIDKPNHCEFCLKSFIRVSQLIGHKTKYHSNQMFKEQIEENC